MSSLRDKLAEIRDDLAFVSTHATGGLEAEMAAAAVLDAAHDALVDVIVELDAAALKETR